MLLSNYLVYGVTDFVFKNRAKNTTRKEAIAELKRVKEKNKHIINLLKATVEHPEGIIQDTLFQIVSANTIQNIIKEMTKNDREYKEKIYLSRASIYVSEIYP
ncbi:TPA: hypothetical protein ACQUHP_005783 [Bacillus cereus]